jgi:hypothetical protein
MHLQCRSDLFDKLLVRLQFAEAQRPPSHQWDAVLSSNDQGSTWRSTGI